MTIFSGYEAGTGARGLEAFLRERIAEGALSAGTRLPPIREAAWALRCAPGTVARAYRALVVAGLAHGEVGRGTFVGGASAASNFPPSSPRAGVSGERGLVDLAVNAFRMINPEEFLSEALASGIAFVSQGMGYQPPGGDRVDREAALSFLSCWREDLDPESIIVTGGTQSALFSTLLALRDTGALACEALTYPGVLSVAQSIGMRLHAVTMDDEGMCPRALDRLAARGGVGVVVLMTGIQNPTGLRMPERRIAVLAEVAARHGLTVIEDQVYGFLGDEGVSGFSRLVPDRTVLITGLSKCVSPALRVGYAAGPALLMRRVLAVESAMQLMVSPVLTRAASHILLHPAFDGRLRALRQGTARRATLAAAILPGVREEAMTGGIAWMELENGWHAEDFAAEALRLGVRVLPSRHFAADPRTAPEAVRICLAAEPDEGRLVEALTTLASLAGQTGQRPPAVP